MAVRIEKDGPVWTVIHDRPEARNAMDPESADALTEAPSLRANADPTMRLSIAAGTCRVFHIYPLE